MFLRQTGTGFNLSFIGRKNKSTFSILEFYIMVSHVKKYINIATRKSHILNLKKYKNITLIFKTKSTRNVSESVKLELFKMFVLYMQGARF